LNQQDRERLHSLLLKGPDKMNREIPLWTCQRVAKLIEREFGVRYHPGHVWKILVALGWRLQRATGSEDDRKEHKTLLWGSNI
jgi:transposase